jgi:hypothetical protein
MVGDRFSDPLDETGEVVFWGWRCVLCGEIIDPIIVRNRIRHVLRTQRPQQQVVIAVGAWTSPLFNGQGEPVGVGACSDRGGKV